MTSVSVVILNFNGEKLLRQFLPSVIRHSGEAKIIVADNGSTDQSVSVLRATFPSVKIIELDKNHGFCGGYNRALKQIDTPYYVLLNSDVEVTPEWLTPLINVLDQNPQVAAVQPKILSFHERKKFEYAGAGGGFIDALGYPFCRGRVFDHVEEDLGQYDDQREIFWATGACFMIRSEAYWKFGGLDEDLFAHMEEIDLCWKINRSGQKVYYNGRSLVYHVGAGTLAYENVMKTYLNFRNGLVLIFKHLDPTELVYKLPFRLALDWLAALIFVLKGKWGNAASVLRAHIHFFKGFSKFRKKRAEIRKEYPCYPRNNIHPGLIIFDYYLRGRKQMKSIVPDRATLS